MQGSAESVVSEGAVLDGRLRLERLLGRGAAGSVWLATHLTLSSPMAVKLLDQAARQLFDEDELARYVDRFRFEAQVSARLAGRTRHIVAAHDAGIFEGIPYLVMEYAPGRSLEEVLGERGTLDDAELVRLAEQVGEALGAAHQLGIVHRDVKAANILCLEREGEPTLYKLADFGLARITGERPLDLPAPKKTAEGLIVGTPAYMAPEQIAASGDYAPPTDLWALGVVLYEATTGRLPFDGGSLTELALSISSRSHATTVTQRGHDPALDAFFARALAKRPENRFTSARELVAAFRAALAGEALRPVGAPVDEPLDLVPKRPRWPLVVGSLAFLAIAIGAGAWLVHERAASSAEVSQAAVQGPEPRREPTPTATPTVERPEVVPNVERSATVVASAHVAPGPKGRTNAAPSSSPRVEPAVTATPAASAPAPEPPSTIQRPPIDKSEIQ